MRYYITLDDEGYIVGAAFSDIPPPGNVRQVENPPPPTISQFKTKFENGEYVSYAPWVEVTYSQNRAMAYPAVGEQMDMLWHAMRTGALPKVEPFYSQIAEVKNKYPKQTNSK